MSEHRLGEIVIERPRDGMRISSTRLTGYQKELNRITQEATEEGLLSPYIIKNRYKSKWLSDHLGPLRRLLRSQVGQPWDLVYSRLCRELNPRTLAGQHVISHLWDFVEQHVEIIDGLPYTRDHYWSWNGERRSLAESYRTQFYVHPETGLLCVVPLICRRKRPKPIQESIKINTHEQYRQINKIWYRITFKPLTTMTMRDVLLKTDIDQTLAAFHYCRPVYAAIKRQCGKRELKKIRSMMSKAHS